MLMKEILVFTLQDQRFAIELASAERVIWAVEITPIPKAPPQVAGAINLYGQVIQVINLRKAFGYPDREMELSDQMVVCKLGEFTAAFWVDSVEGISCYNENDIVPAESVFPKFEWINSVINKDQKIILIYKWDKLAAFEDLAMASERT